MDLALLGTAAALIAVAFQFADAGTGWHDLRRAHSGGLRRVTVRRLILGRPYRLLPPVVAAASLVLCLVAGEPVATLENAALLLLAIVFVVVGARIAVAARLAWRSVADDERTEVVRMLEDAERRSAKRIEGLGDRVTRALQILREQQG